MTLRFIVALLASCLLVVLALGWWLHRKPAPPHRSPPAGTPTPTTAIEATPSPTSRISAAERTRYRLAGTVVGDAEYVVVEHPDGRSDLYRPGEVIEGLGKVVAIGADSAAFEGDGGRVELHLLPEATPSAAAEETAETAMQDVTPKRSRSPSPSEREPSP
jgi:hypothetical protein